MLRDDCESSVRRPVCFDRSCTILQPVKEAYVPIIKAVISGIDIDFGFATIQRDKVPADLDLTDDSVLRGADETNARSLNGSRVTDAMLKLVPNVEAFRDTLRAIKVWAKREFRPLSSFCATYC